MIYLAIYMISWLVLFAIQRSPLLRVDVFFTLMSLLMILGSVKLLLVYPFEPSPLILFLIALFHLFFTVSFQVFHNLRPEKSSVKVLKAEKVFCEALLFVSLLFAVLQFGEALINGRIPIYSSFLDAGRLREAHWQQANSQGAFNKIINLMAYLAFLFVISFPYARRYWRKSYLPCVVIFSAVLEYSLQQGARALIVISVIGYAATYISIFPTSISRKLIILVLFLIMFYFFGAEFYLSRNSNFALAPDLFLRHNCAGASFTALGSEMPNSVKALILASCYFSSPPYFFEIFWTGGGVGSFGLGTYNFGIISQGSFTSFRQEIASLLQQEALGQNPWATSARDAYIDFGFFAPLFAAVLGAGVGMFAPINPRDGYIAAAKFSVLVCFAFFLPFMSPLIIRPIIYPLILLLFFRAVIMVWASRQRGSAF